MALTYQSLNQIQYIYSIGPPGLFRVVDRLGYRSMNMDELDISRNNLGDDGFKFLTDKIEQRAIVKK